MSSVGSSATGLAGGSVSAESGLFAGVDTSQLPAFRGEIRKAVKMMTEQEVDQWLKERGYKASQLKVTNHPNNVVLGEDDDTLVGVVEGIYLKGLKDGDTAASLCETIVHALEAVKDRDFGRYSVVEFGFVRRIALALDGNTLSCDVFFSLTTSECPKGGEMLEEAQRVIEATLRTELEGSPFSIGNVAARHGGRRWQIEDSPALLLIKEKAGGSSAKLVDITVRGSSS